MFPFIYSEYPSLDIETCSNSLELKEALLDQYSCNFIGTFEKYKHIDSLDWRIVETDSTIEVLFGIKDDIIYRENIEIIGTKDDFVIIKKENCQVIHHHP